MNITHIKSLAASLLLATTLSACGSDSLPTSSASSTTTTINGQAIAGAVNGTVTVRTGSATGTQLATASVTNGIFSVTLNNTDLGSDLDFEVTGRYRDEVSGLPVDLTTANPLALRVAANHYQAGQLGNAPITPDTSVIRAMVQTQVMTLTQAENAYKTAFGYIPNLGAKPFDPYTTTVTTAYLTVDMEAAFRVGMFSQLGAELSLTAVDLAELPEKLASDLADAAGAFDGVDALGNPVQFTSGVNLQTAHQLQPLGNTLSIALSKFSKSPANVALVPAPTMGVPPIVADMPPVTKQVTLASGDVIDITVAIENFTPFLPGFRDVKTTHVITLTDSLGAAVDTTASALVDNISLEPWMYMFRGMQHGTSSGATVQTAPGTYKTDIYYRMATGMDMMGVMQAMGQWTLDVTLNDISTGGALAASRTFYPNVKMNTMDGNTDLLLATTYNPALTWNKMGELVPREHRVWLKDATPATAPATGHDLTVFVTTQDMTMAGPVFPAVTDGLAIPAITTVTCDVYADTGTGLQWHPMTQGLTVDTYGEFSTTGLLLDTVAQNILTLRLNVDGYAMTTLSQADPQLKFIAR